MREAEVDEKWIVVFINFAVVEIIQNLLSVLTNEQASDLTDS